MAMSVKENNACSNCTRPFSLKGENRRGRLPFLLSCCHTVCGACISAASRKAARDVIVCHHCGAKTPYIPALAPEDQLFADVLMLGRVSALSLNLKCSPRQRLAQKLIRAREHTQPEIEEPKSILEDDLRCDECNKRASRKCLQCVGFFCDACFQMVHARATSLRKHTSIPAYQAATPLPTCPSHASPLSYYCSSEKTPVCSDCAVQSHKTCSVITISEAAESYRADIQQLIKDAGETIAAMKMKKQELASQLQDVNQQAISCSAGIEVQLRDLHSTLQKREHDLQRQLMKGVDRQMRALMEKETCLIEEIAGGTSAVSRATELLKSDVNLMKHSDQLHQSLTAVKNMVIQDLPSLTLYSFTLSPTVKKTLCVAGNIQASEPPTQNTETYSITNSLDLSEAKRFVPNTSSSPTPASLPLPHSSPSLSPSPPPISLKPDLEKSGRSSLSPLARPYTPRKSSSGGSSLASDRSFSHSRTASPVTVKREDTVSVWISHIESPEEFYVQLKEEEVALQTMSETLNDLCSQDLCRELKVTDITQDMMVCAQFTDDLWYRAEIVSFYPSPPAYVSVFYLDYGNSTNLPLSQIAELPSSLADGPFYAYKCKLSGIQPPSKYSNVAPPSWSPNAVTQFRNLVNAHEDDILMKEYYCNAHGCREVELFTVLADNSIEAISVKLLHMGLASRTQRPATQLKIPPPRLPLPSKTLRSETQSKNPHLPSHTPSPLTEVTISFCLSPCDFYVQQASSEAVLKSLANKIQSRSRHILHSTSRGSVCAAQSLTDKKFYRAVICGRDDDLQVGGDCDDKETMINVRCVDYGNVERVKKVWELDPELATIPAQAIHCTLHNITPKTGSSWPHEVCGKFIKDSCGKVLLMEIYGEGQPLPVKLIDGDTKQPLHSLLVMEDLARYTLPESHVLPKKKTKRRSKGLSPAFVVQPPTPTGPLAPLPPPVAPLQGTQSVKKSAPPTHHVQHPPPPPTVSSFWVSGSFSVGQTVDCVVVQVNSPGEFYVQSLMYSTEIRPLLAGIPATQPSQQTWAPGEQCLAPFNGEGWYRGKVLSKNSRETYEIVYLDFGNTAVLPVTDLAATVLPSHLTHHLPQAVKACLFGVTSWDKAISYFFSSLVLEKRVTATVQANQPRPSDSPIPLTISLNGSDIATLLSAMGNAAHCPLPDTSLSSLSGVSEEEVVIEEEVLENGEEEQDPITPVPLKSLSCTPISPEGPPPPLTPNGCHTPTSPTAEVPLHINSPEVPLHVTA